MTDNLDILKDAYGEEFKFHDENVVMLSWYGRRVVKTIEKRQYASCLSLGIGYRIVNNAILNDLTTELRRYVIVEGSGALIRDFSNRVNLSPHVSVIHSLFEDFDATEKFDAIEMGFVLEHVDDPHKVLEKYAGFLKPGGTIFISVPNAKSLHRQFGWKAGMLHSMYTLSEDDLKLGHKRYFDKESLIDLAISSGLKVLKVEGIFLKPFSTSQLKSLALTAKVINSLFEVGIDYPDICNSIYVEATL
jgi:SAM-dependent methyltransferase